MKNYQCKARYEIIEDDWLALHRTLEPTKNSIHISKTITGTVHTIHGVPGRLVDVVVDDRDYDDLHYYTMVLEIGQKIGKYDGQVRTRLTLRYLQCHQADKLPQAKIQITKGHKECVFLVYDPKNGDTLWISKWLQLRSNLEGYNPERIVMWHWRRYYSHLSQETAQAAAKEWALSEFAEHWHKWSLAEANRSASRFLYRVSRMEGWRKLTLRERRKLGVPESYGCWLRQDWLADKYGAFTGVGENSTKEAC